MIVMILYIIILLNIFIDKTNSLNFWDSSHGDGSRAELLTMLIHLNQSVIVAGHKGSHSPHSHYFKSSSFSKAMEGGKLIYPTAHAPLVFSHNGYNLDISEDDMKVAFNFYNKDKTIKQADAFICSNPVSFCELFMPLNRSIIWFPSHRYSIGAYSTLSNYPTNNIFIYLSIGRCSTSKWKRLSEHIISSITPSNSRPIR
jgi:hypothetical protein